MAERYPKSSGFAHDGHVTLTIIYMAHPRVSQPHNRSTGETGENPGGNRESSSARTHKRQLPNLERLSLELGLIPRLLFDINIRYKKLNMAPFCADSN